MDIYNFYTITPTLFLNPFTPSRKFMDNEGLKKEPGLSVKLWSARPREPGGDVGAPAAAVSTSYPAERPLAQLQRLTG